MSEEKNSDVFLRPRFKMELDESQQKIIEKFKDNLNDGNCKYCSKIIDAHIIIDVPKEDNHFWSPQLYIEIESLNDKKSLVKGLFGPKPQVWTLFMFIHFAMAVAFIGFSIMAYVKWTLKSNYKFSFYIAISILVLWGVMYFLGRVGKATGYKQMDELHTFMMKILKGK